VKLEICVPVTFWAFCDCCITLAMPKSSTLMTMPGTRLLAEHEEVGRLDVAVRHAQRVGQRQRPDRAVHDLKRLEHPARLAATDPVVVPEERLERLPVEPLEHHVRQPRPARRRQRADVPRLHDAGRAARQLAEQLALLHELIEQLVAHLDRRVRQRREALERHGFVPDAVHRPEHHPEPALADHSLDGVFVGHDRADQGEAVVGLGQGPGIVVQSSTARTGPDPLWTAPRRFFAALTRPR
jgi:hypothetical protein